MKRTFLLSLLAITLVNAAIIRYNVSKLCDLPACDFPDPSVWENLVVPSSQDTVIIDGIFSFLFFLH